MVWDMCVCEFMWYGICVCVREFMWYGICVCVHEFMWYEYMGLGVWMYVIMWYQQLWYGCARTSMCVTMCTFLSLVPGLPSFFGVPSLLCVLINTCCLLDKVSLYSLCNISVVISCCNERVPLLLWPQSEMLFCSLTVPQILF